MNTSPLGEKSRRTRRVAASFAVAGLVAVGSLVLGTSTQAATTANPDLARSCSPLNVVVAVDASSAIGDDNGPTAAEMGAAVSAIAKSPKMAGNNIRLVTFSDTATSVDIGGATDFTKVNPAAIDQWVADTYAKADYSAAAAPNWVPLGSNVATNPGDLVIWLAAGSASGSADLDTSLEAVRSGGTHLVGVAFAPDLASAAPGFEAFANAVDTNSVNRIVWDASKPSDITTTDIAVVGGAGAANNLTTLLSTLPDTGCSLTASLKSATVKDVDGDGKNSANDVATFTFTVRNAGTADLTKVAIAATDGSFKDVACADSIAAGATADCSTEYTLTADDLAAAAVIDKATAKAVGPNGGAVASDAVNLTLTTKAPATAPAATETTGKMRVLKSATLATDADKDEKVTLGDTIKYEYAIKNIGTVPLTEVTLKDYGPGKKELEVTGSPIATLAVDAEDMTTYSSTHVVTQADVDAGYIENQATVTAKDGTATALTVLSDTKTTPDLGSAGANPNLVETTNPAGLITNDAKDPATDPTAVAVFQVGRMTLKVTSKIADTDTSGSSDVGDVVTFSYEITNTGTVTLKEVTVTDTLLKDLKCTMADIAPTKAVTCEATGNTYTLTAEDVTKGSIASTATAAATTQSGLKIADVVEATTVKLAATGDLSLGDRVWFDTNRDGIQNNSEPGLTGVTVTLTGAGSDQQTTKTDNLGRYEFTGLTEGTYTLTFTPPTGYSYTTLNAGTDDSLDSDVSTSGTASVTLSSATVTDNDPAGLDLTNPTVDAGMVVGTTTVTTGGGNTGTPTTSRYTGGNSSSSSSSSGTNTYTGGNAARFGGFALIALGLGFVARLVARRRQAPA